MSDTPYFHATMNEHGDSFVFDRGGRYEKVDENGIPQQRIAAGEFIGYEISDIPELAASKAPEAAVFAVLKNYVNDTGDASGIAGSITLNIYEIQREPDVDLTGAIAGDFTMIEEVRYRRPSENPVKGVKVHCVELPGHVLGDVELAYLPPNQIIRKWAVEVKKAIRRAIDGDGYPDDVAEWGESDRPNLEAYYPNM